MSAKVLVIVFAEILIASRCNADVAPVSSDDAVRAGVLNFQLTMNTTSQSKSPLSKINSDFHRLYLFLLRIPSDALGCCPLIVRPGPTGSVIAGFSGYRGNVAIIVDFGTCPAQPAGGF